MVDRGRRQRGYRTQIVCAELWGKIFPGCTDAGPSRAGPDLLNTPGFIVEIKARANFDPLAWLRQAAKNKGKLEDIPVAIFRCNGQGEAMGGRDWPVIIAQGDLIRLIAAANRGGTYGQEG